MAKNSRVLVISDLHAPYYHQDTIPFLTAIKELFKPDHIVLTGDEADYHCLSFHDTDPDLPFSPSSELEKTIEYLKPLYELFPKADILESNHGSMAYRKGKHHGIPRHILKDYRDVLEAPKTWKWHPELTITLSDGRDCYFVHGKSADGLKLSQSMSCNSVQGHFHQQASIRYFNSPKGVMWSLISGCMIDDISMAFAYNKLQLNRPMLACAIILDGQPKILPLLLNSEGRWIRKIV